MTSILGRFGLALLFLLSGCAQLSQWFAPPRATHAPVNLRAGQPLKHFKLDGRMSVKTETGPLSGSIAWQRGVDQETLTLSGPLGQGAAEIRRVGGLLTLKTADGTVFVETSDERMMEKAVGLRLPLDGLVWWLSALPRPEVEFSAVAGEDGRVASLDQDGWHIEYSRYRQVGGRWLPGRIFANRGELEFRLVVDAWEPL